MGRMLETFKLGDSRRAPLSINKPADGTPVQDCVVDWEIGAEVPFVEVGGPNKKVELSPGLMRHPAQTAPQAPHLVVEAAPPPVIAKPRAVNLTETKPMTAAFQPWPASAPTPLGISTEIIAYHHPDHAASQEYAALLQAMRGGLKADSASALLLTGLKPHVGVSTVLLNLAVGAALKQKLRVIVVDANVQGGGLAQRLGEVGSTGLAEVMEGAVALEQAIVKTRIAALHLLPAGSSACQPFAPEALTWLMGRLRERYDLIFIDGPTLDDAELAKQVPHADGTYLVLPQGETISKGSAQTISRMGGRLCGLIHTHFEM